jgi:hypothetical protein
VFWSCACGNVVKAVLDMSNASMTVQCPNPCCKVTRTLPGKVTHLSVETAPGVWTGTDLAGLVHPVDQR